MKVNVNDNVSKRLVLFLGGFDPRGGRHYYSMFKEESKKMATTSHAKIEVSARKRLSKHITQWLVNYQDQSREPVQTEFRALNYDDIVRRFWHKSEVMIIIKMLKTYLLLWRHKAFKNEWNVLKPIVYMGYVFAIVLTISGALLSGSLIALWLFTSLALNLKGFLSLIVLIIVIVLIRSIDKKLNHYWLIRGICFSGGQEQYDDPQYEERMAFFVNQLIEAEASGEFDEIQVIGHSSGSLWASEIVGRALLENETLGSGNTQVNVLTLGSCIALMSGTTLDKGYHQYLEALGNASNVDWLDISERCDFAANYMVNPVELLPNMKGRKSHLPRLRRARFYQLFDEESLVEFKKDRYRVHFQFICSSEKDGDYNYFRWTCGNQVLRKQLVNS